MDLFIIAGPNGVGKTTFAREFLPNYADCKNFVNADLIAQGMAPFSPESRIPCREDDAQRNPIVRQAAFALCLRNNAFRSKLYGFASTTEGSRVS
jgi:predicted ABC-type ATPase